MTPIVQRESERKQADIDTGMDLIRSSRSMLQESQNQPACSRTEVWNYYVPCITWLETHLSQGRRHLNQPYNDKLKYAVDSSKVDRRKVKRVKLEKRMTAREAKEAYALTLV